MHPATTSRPHRRLLTLLATLAIATAPLIRAQTTPPADPTGADSRETVKLDKLVVQAQRAVGYTQADTSFGSKTPVPLRDLPASVQILNLDFWERTGALSPDQVLKNVSGLTRGATSEGNYGFANNYFARGLDVKLTRDGFTEGLGRYGNYSRTLGDVERIEVLKGPGSALYGSGAGGGTINFVSKSPQSIPATSLKLVTGAWDTAALQFGSTGPVDAAKSLLYRLDAGYRRTDGFRDLAEQSTETAATLRWTPSAAHSLTAKLDFRHIEREPDTVGIPIKGARVAAISPETQLHTPFALSETDLAKFSLLHQWQIGPALALHSQFVAMDRDLLIQRNRSGVNQPAAGVPTTNAAWWNLTGRRFDDQSDATREGIAQSELIWQTASGSLNHTVLVGAELHEVRTDTTMSYANLASIADIRSPVIPEKSFAELLFAPAFDRELTLHRYAAYVQDQIEITEKLKARVGGRFDYFSIRDAGNYNVASGGLHTGTLAANGQSYVPKTAVWRYEDNRNLAHELTGQAGLVYQPTKQTSFFTGWSTGAKANYDTESTRSAYPPETFKQIEIGNKSSFLNDRLSFTAALYRTERRNFLQTIAGIPQAVGATRTDGFELDIAFVPAPGWTIIANYARQKATYRVLSATADIGKRVAGVPDELGALWSTYEFTTGTLKGFGIGAGVTGKDRIFVDQASTQILPGYVVYDAAIFYRQPRWEVHVAVNNLTDEAWFPKTANTAGTPGDPRNATFAVSLRF